MSDLARNIRTLRAPLVLPLALLLLAGALAGCQTTGSPAPGVQAAPEPPMTHTRAAEQCWMQTEKGHADKSLDQRADIVTQCIADKMKGAQGGKPNSKPDAKPDAKPDSKPKADAKPAPKN